MITWDNFSNLIVVDYEFKTMDGEIPIPICYVARNLSTGKYVRHWMTGKETKPEYPIDKKSLVIAYMANAEMGCHLALNFSFPIYLLDLFPEFRSMTNGLKLPFKTPKDGTSLINVCNFLSIPTPGVDYKNTMREEILKGGPYSEKRQTNILDYCQTDVDMTSNLFFKLKPKITLKTALLHGKYMGAVARMENFGVPITTEKFFMLRDCWDILTDELVWRINPEYGFYEKVKGKWILKRNLFAKWIIKEGIPWKLTPTGLPVLDTDYIEEQAEIYPKLKHFAEVKRATDQLKLKKFPVGKDGRNRTSLMPFRTITSRNAPSSVKYIFGPSVWLRNLIAPPEGYAISYIDYAQQEIAIAAKLSNDPNLLSDYKSGDIYTTFGKNIRIIPPEGNKNTHPKERSLMKTCFIGINYGMGPYGFARKTKVSIFEAKAFMGNLKRRYPKFFHWRDSFVDSGILSGNVKTSWGWKFFTKNLERINTLRDWPMQTVGAEITQLAICLCFDNGVEVIAPVHDAIMIQAPISEIKNKVKIAQKCMEDASEYILGFRIRTDTKTFRYPEHYRDPRGDWMWEKVWDILNGMNPTELHARIYEKINENISLEDFDKKPMADKTLSKKKRGQLLMKPENFSEKAMLARIKKQGNFSQAQIMSLIRATKDSDFDIEHEVDWKNDSYQTIMNRIKNKTTIKKIIGEIY